MRKPPRTRVDSSASRSKSVRKSNHSWRDQRPFLFSVAVHAVLILLLALLAVPVISGQRMGAVILDESALLPLDSQLAESNQLVPELELPVLVETPLDAEDSVPASLTSPSLEADFSKEMPTKSVENLSGEGSTQVAQVSPRNGRGATHVAVGNYDEAMDQITRELIRLLKDGEVVVVWLFDQSTSMEDDRAQIGARIGRVYQELTASGFAEHNALTTGIASYSGDYAQHTATPTSDVRQIYRAIERVPIDTIGKELTCKSVIEAIARHRRYVENSKRQFALIVVTDESGDPEDNQRNLEKAILEAQSTGCRVYFLGRESMFGYPYEHLAAVDLQHGISRVSTYDRGPETPFIEQLQTDGFAARTDAVLSGFGPYEQVRLTRETGGLFFMMPDDKPAGGPPMRHHYDPVVLDHYLPDWRPRSEVVEDLKRDPLQLLMTKVIQELNPFQSASVNAAAIRQLFSSDPAILIGEIQQEQVKMRAYIAYLNQAIHSLEVAKPLRDASPSLRQQANYDLLFAQLLTYRIRAAELHDYLTLFLQERPAGGSKWGWRIVMTKQLMTPQNHWAEVALARSFLEHIVTARKGTPWAAAAQLELDRGFGAAIQPVPAP
ncbi:VWA domain-containing protein [Blastopirellula sp. JC732]|uniref:VWA domain-containing protein n=1 Tax=Blastopirellula sediminis TaxID=2894196 RepID=A0A9X1MI47_9BACT|nr:vWA domain-containing protein [Blastopirellula sediminis]MCC9608006.1 VWA domain-containing protein [Blastopirellula sediminis]MCC9627201.1 VWA domain-containing protein [Blastopirellula sediminis]